MIKELSERRSTLHGIMDTISPNRRCGNTTRCVDNAIQLLYKGYIVDIQDHHEYGRNEDMNKYLLRKIKQRLFNEHKLMFDLGRVKIDFDELTIQFVDRSIRKNIDITKGGVTL